MPISAMPGSRWIPAAWLADAASVAAAHQLAFYDAAWGTSARASGVAFVSADAQLVTTGLAESPTAVVERLRLRHP